MQAIEKDSNLKGQQKYFHGLRDFYYLLKNVCENLKKEKYGFIDRAMNFFSDKTLEIIVNAMMRNFGGLPQEIIKEHMDK